MKKNISVCGADCGACSFFEKKMCKGCSASEGKVFHCPEGKECAIYHCCVSENYYGSCIECADIPCAVWKKTRDPNMSDAEFRDSISERIERLEEMA
ncbi:MAG: DUF3795 domain-containing protein [Ruminococcus sp.]|nr:DUF3795 domain-containing protein [Ruminococcus sp.]